MAIEKTGVWEGFPLENKPHAQRDVVLSVEGKDARVCFLGESPPKLRTSQRLPSFFRPLNRL
jgi:hypothetical protein